MVVRFRLHNKEIIKLIESLIEGIIVLEVLNMFIL